MKKSKKATSVEHRRLSLEQLEARQMLAVTYWVDDDDAGSNAGAADYGTVITNPFVTIQEAAAVAAAGDTVNIRAGTYRETVTPTNSGTVANPIVYQAYNGEQVTVSGAETISGFTQLSGNIYQANMPTSLGIGSDQIFVNGQMQLWARWPNTLSLDVSRPVFDTSSTITSVVNVSDDWEVSLTDAGIPGDASDYVGGYVNISAGLGWVRDTGLIKASSSGNTLDFDLVNQPTTASVYQPVNNDEYFISGTFNALDSAGEWFRDSGGTLSLWQPGGGDPDTSTVEYKSRDFAFDLGGIDYVTLDGIDLFASTIRTNENSDYNTIQNMDARYLSHSEIVSGSPWNYGTLNDGIILAGSNNTLRDSTIAYSSGNGVTISGTGQRVINNTIRDTNYLGTDAAAIYTASTLGSPSSFSTKNIEIAHNTIYDTGRSGINVRYLQSSNILNNEIYNAMLQSSDGGGIYTFGTLDGPDFNDAKGTVIAYNRISDVYAFGDPGDSRTSVGIYLDAGSNGYTVNDNIVWNTERALQVGTFSVDLDHKFYNNTLIGDVYALDSHSVAGQQNTTGSEFWNNILVGTVDFFNAGWNANGSNYVTGNVNTVQFVDPGNADFRLTAASPAIDLGTATPPYTRGSLGAAPDAGAIEFNTAAFTAGVGSNRDLNGNAIAVSTGTTAVNAGYYDTLGPSAAPADRSIVRGVAIKDVSSENNSLRGAENTIYELEDYTNSATQGLTGVGSGTVFGAGVHSTLEAYTSWTSAAGDTAPEITFDLRGVYDLDGIQVWNFNSPTLTGRATQDIDIYISPDNDVNNLVLVTSVTLAPVADPFAYAGEFFDLSSFALADSARLVRFDITSNYGADRTGLSEVQFSAAEPAPSSIVNVTGITIEDVSSENNPDRGAVNTIFELEDPDNDAPQGLTGPGAGTLFGAGVHDTFEAQTQWTSASGDPTPYITFDLEGVYDLDGMQVWNLNNFSLASRASENIDIYISPDDNVANLAFVTSITLTQLSGFTLDPGEFFDLSSFALADSARLVRLDITSNFSADRTGLSEVQFSANVPAPPLLSEIDLREGASYYESDQTNTAVSPIRPNDLVDANAAGVVGGIVDGEWLEYTIDVQTAGTYDLTFELGTFGAGDSVTASVRNTSSSWTTLGEVTTADLIFGNDYGLTGVSLDAGLQYIRIQFGGDGFDFTQFEIDGGTAVVSADFDNSGGIINGFDFLSWQRGFGIQAPNAVKADGDADNDTDVDATDLGFWEAQFGGPAPAVAAPATAAAATAPAPAPLASVVTTEVPIVTAEWIDAALALAYPYQTTSDLIGKGQSLLEELEPLSNTAVNTDWAHDRFLELSEDLGVLRDRIATGVSSFRSQATTWATDWSEELDAHQEELVFETALEQLFGA